MTRVLVTGAAGYIGSVLTRHLLQEGCSVVAVDRFFFGDEPLAEVRGNPKLKIEHTDIRDLTPAHFAGVDAVCDLAGLSNDPSGDINPELTGAINHLGRAHVAKTAREAGVGRYVLSSSCSTYGAGQGLSLTEESPTAPLTVYAKANLQAERDVLALATDRFVVTVLRNATVFGLSPRMRFDLVVNLMTLHAVQKGRIFVMGGGRQWRPLVHVADVARAFGAVLRADASRVQRQVFNVGMANYQVLGLAYLVRESLPFSLQIDVAPDDADKRDYNVSFDKARDALGFSPKTTVEAGVREIYEALKTGTVDTGPRTVTVGWYRNILDAKKLLDAVVHHGRVI